MADSPLPGWPDGPVHLLLQARLSPLPRAAEAWAEWQAHHTVDDAGWAEVRLLAGLAGTRHGTISDDLARRIDGLRKFVWARNSLRLDRSVRILDALAAADIPVMLLKGGARVALEPRALAARFLRDLDLLVPPDRIAEATAAILADGWRPMTGSLPGARRAAAFDRQLAGEPPGARGGPEVDLHAWSLHMEPGPAGDEGLWARARAAALRGRPVRVPAPVDMALIALMHGPVADIDAPADWAVDAADALADPNMDWETLVAEAQRRRLGAALNWGLSYLDHIEAVTLPGGLLAALRAGADTAQERELAAWLKPKARWTPADRLSTERMKRARPRGALPRPGPRTRLRDTALFRAGSGTKGSEGLVELVFDSPPRDRARLSFDLVDADGWLARLRLTVNALDRLSGRRRWRFALPRALRGTPRIVALDGSGQPVTRHGVRLVASAASGPGLACETVSNETVEAKG